MNNRVSLYLVLTLLGLTSGVLKPPDWVPHSDVYIPGDINIGVMAGATYDHCKFLSKSRTQAQYILRQYLKEINKNGTMLPNITVGMAWIDNCWELDVSIMRGIKFMPLGGCFKECCSDPIPGSKHPSERGCYDVAGFIAPWRDDQAIPLSRLASMYEIPHISLGATNDVLSDRNEFPYFMRINPPDSLQSRVIMDAIMYFNWTYVSLISDYTESSRNIMTSFKKLAKENGICIAFFDEIGSDFKEPDYEQFARRVTAYKTAKAIVVLAETVETGYFIKAMKELEFYKDFIIFTTDRFTTKRRGPTSVNSLGIGYVFDGGNTDGEEFKEHYLSYSPWKYLTDPLAEVPRDLESLGCSLELPEGHNESCFMQYQTWTDVPTHTMYGHFYTYIDGFHVFLKGLRSLILADCPEAFVDKSLLKACVKGPRYLKFLYNVTFNGMSGLIKFDQNGDGIIDYSINQLKMAPNSTDETKYESIGQWGYDNQQLEMDEEKVKWYDFDVENSNGMESLPESLCAKPCRPGEFYIQGELKCCWDCRKCRSNEVVRNDSLGCEICPILQWPEQKDFTECVDIDSTYMTWDDPIAIAIEICSTLGLMSCFCITYIVVRYRKHRVIKGSSIEQMVLILMAIYLCYITTILLIVRPSFYLCYIEYCTYHLSCTFIFVPLLLKTTRLYRIFKAAEKLSTSIRFVSAGALMVVTLILITGEISALCVSVVLYPIGDTRQMPVVTEPFVELVCINNIYNLIIPLSYNLLILLMCLLFGFLTRKLPDNFNESWYIFLSVATTLFIWVAFLPTYFMAFYAYHKGALLALALILNAVVTSICLFAPKIYAVYFVPERDIKTSNFDSASRSVGGTSTSSIRVTTANDF